MKTPDEVTVAHPGNRIPFRTVPAANPTVNVGWLSKELPDPADQREYARERVIVVVTEAIATAMEQANMRRADLAEVLGKTKGHVSQVLSGRRNMTLNTLGDILWACGQELEDLETIPLGYVACPSAEARKWLKQGMGAKEPVSNETIDILESQSDFATGEWPSNHGETVTPQADPLALQPQNLVNDSLATAA